jgi:hypothetical protein
MARSMPAPETHHAVPAWRTAATVLLILHLFFLGVGLAVNAGGGKSLLAPALFRIPLARTYLKLLWMDVGYDFYVASALPEDGSHRLELRAAREASAEAATVLAELPPPGMQPRIRRQRYQQLAYHVAFLDELYAENSDVRTELPLAIAETWLRELNAHGEPFDLTCWREPSVRLPKAIERAPSRPREGGPRTTGPTLYEPVPITVHLVWNPDEGRYQGSRAEPEGQTAEVVRGAATLPATRPGEDPAP